MISPLRNDMLSLLQSKSTGRSALFVGVDSDMVLYDLFDRGLAFDPIVYLSRKSLPSVFTIDLGELFLGQLMGIHSLRKLA